MKKIHIKTVWKWDEYSTKYIKIYDHFYNYDGPTENACGASSQQTSVEASQQRFMNQMMSQASTVFGNASSVFNSLVNTFTPTIQAGPNQQGFSPAELSAMNSQAITGAGQAYKNAKAAVGNEEAAVGGGNVTLPSGVNEATDTGLAENAANLTSTELNKITQENYATGRSNYENAVNGLAGSINVFNTASTAGNAATSSGEAAANTANQIAQENNSWMSAAGGALGAIGGAATGGLMTHWNTSTNTSGAIPSGATEGELG